MEENLKQSGTSDIIHKLEDNLIKLGGLSSKDISQIRDRNIPLENIENQLNIFKKGIAKVQLDRAAKVGDGINKLDNSELEYYSAYFDKEKSHQRIIRFIPASGAASRMFKFLSEFLNDFDLGNESINAYINRTNCKDLRTFLAGIEKFPFYKPVIKLLYQMHPEAESWETSQRYYHFIKLLLQSDEFGYANKPKGVLPFHKYKSHTATAVEEHLAESVFYTNDSVGLHLTVSENHRYMFEDIIQHAKKKIEKENNIKIFTTFSYQDKSTDTIAVNPDNSPFRDDDEQLVFRPGGHGALIQNMDNLDADIIFIQNIDNVIQKNVEDVSIYKKALCGVMLELQQKIFKTLIELQKKDITDQQIEEVANFIADELGITRSDDFEMYTRENKIDKLLKILDRPIRVCGMVKNEGEPGGGPFWTIDKRGNKTLQIVESSQVDIENEQQKEILKSATHFNPVDLVCGTKNYKGEKFSLAKYIDPERGFIVDKSKNGKRLKGYELPGLWNGAMAKWITVFVEVPLITFNPVKTVNDLLKPTHQPQSGY